jgi:hypothetical protein
MPVMSVRLSEQEFERLTALAREEEREKSVVARQLLMDGLKYKLLQGYREGTVSLSKLSHALDMSFSETVDLLAAFGLPAPIRYDEYLKGRAVARRAIR